MNDESANLFDQILRSLLSRYGDRSYPEVAEAMRKNGLGWLVDSVEKDEHLMGMMSQITDALRAEAGASSEYGLIPSAQEEAQGMPIASDGTFLFDARACLAKCRGNCCKKKNYLMISVIDVYRIVASPGAQYFNIRSTMDLFERESPFVELFYMERYGLFFPHIRYLPVGAEVPTRPEDAEDSVCPFLRPIGEVYQHHGRTMPSWASKDAFGCMLMKHKPGVCRLSPLGRSSGMVTGSVTYEYMPPALDCPACESDVEIKVSDYLASVVSRAEERRLRNVHRMLMSYDHAGGVQPVDRDRFHDAVKNLYNIDRLLLEHGLGTEYRPSVDQIVEVFFALAHGDWDAYQRFLDNLPGR
ncbi:MAG: hypothetical protein HY360_17725 [Verrucomicrobia bacterium]|nr:hypothetical protein [Verrucomicrobiota bacterium]